VRNVATYDTLSTPELRTELVEVTSRLVAEYNDLGARVSDYHRDYLMDYAHAAESSVSGKNRVAQHANLDAGAKIVQLRATINGLTLCRDLITFLIISRQPGALPFPSIANEDGDGVPTV
jgi:hypothetical protein